MQQGPECGALALDATSRPPGPLVPWARPVPSAEAGSDLACLGALLVQNRNPDVRADAAIACVLAEGGTRAAAKLVETNLGATPDDARVRHVQMLVGVAAEASERALAVAE